MWTGEGRIVEVGFRGWFGYFAWQLEPFPLLYLTPRSAAGAVYRGMLVGTAAVYARRVDENQYRVVSSLHMANPGPTVRAQPEPSRNTVVAVTIVATATHTAQAV